MARTKQTARKAIGGHAQRVNLEVLQKKKAKAKAASKKPVLQIPAKANSVIICLDGGEICLIVSEESMQKVTEADVKFMCMTRHWQKTKNDPKPYMVAMLHSFLQGYFPQGDYIFSQLPSNLGTPGTTDAYDKVASDLANTLSAYSKVVLFLTTHSDEDRGDLFSGYINKKPAAAKVFPFLQLLLKPLSNIVNGADVVFYVCGSMVTNPQSFNEVKEVAQQSMLLFDAQHLLLAFTVPHLQSLLDNTIIQGFPMSSAAKVALNDCGMLGRHSNIILFTWQEEAPVVEKFIWTDKHLKPWGHLLPVQCPQCGTIQKWIGGSAEKTLSFECNYSDCDKNMGSGGMSLPPKSYTFSIGGWAIPQQAHHKILWPLSHIPKNLVAFQYIQYTLDGAESLYMGSYLCQVPPPEIKRYVINVDGGLPPPLPHGIRNHSTVQDISVEGKGEDWSYVLKACLW
ncbi:hypothetical protein BKA83DRAFT_4128168 [Pisolithus microcarpus]|nr:hypothetical protein BKA83DRAFT_4128168 [Pisolithus microcarpus]